MARKQIGAVLTVGVACCIGVASFAPPASAEVIGPLQNGYAGLCLDAEDDSLHNPGQNGDRIQVWECDPEAGNQKWAWQNPGTWGRIRNGASGKCLDAALGSGSDPGNNGDKVQLWTCNGSLQQDWNLIDIGGGVYAICNGYALHQEGKTMCLDAKNDSTASAAQNGDTVQLWTYLGGINQLWF